ncbi:MAG TPA: tetratricopeptide repeat protein [Sandaracinaceae bacterium LLY-WYZ-13_1]|nr:tetratricopeptide repeat protein [Sandaracinaceae bacterium LLY-WYZ-13_1]
MSRTDASRRRARLGPVLLVAASVGACGGGGSRAPLNRGTSSGGGGEVMFEDERTAREAPPASEDVERGESLLAAGDAAAAEQAFRAAIEADPEDPRAHLDLGLALEMQERFDEAAAAYRAALEIDATFAEALNNLGVLLRDSGQHEDAVRTLREAVRARPGFASAHLNLALALEDAGDVEGAMRSYERVIELAPQEPTARIQLGLLQLATGARDDARITLRRAVPHARGSRAHLSALGNGLRRAGDAEMALRVLRQSIEADEVAPPAAIVAELALAQFAAGHREDAEQTLEGLLESHDDYATAHYLLANMLAAREAFDEAASHYQAYLRAAPDGPMADQARARLEHVRSR